MSAQVITLTDAASGASARVLASQGFNCFSWLPAWPEGPSEALWAPAGFDAGDQRASSGGIPLLFPFPGRIGGATYEFRGRAYQLSPGDGRGNAIHGFVFNRAFRVVERDARSVTGEFHQSVDAPEVADQWPSDFLLRVTYRLDAQRLACDVEYANVGQEDLPCAFGTHAYFRAPLAAGQDVERVTLTAPVDREWVLDDMLPTGELRESETAAALGGGVRLDGRAFDTPYALRPDAVGDVTSRVADPGSGRAIVQTCDDAFGCYVVYTPGHREAVCIEPYTCVPNPFALEARGVRTGLSVLEPGSARRHRITLAAAV